MKRKPVVPRVAAATDIDQIVEHYADEAPASVALRFIDALEQAFDRVSRFPASGSPRYAHDGRPARPNELRLSYARVRNIAASCPNAARATSGSLSGASHAPLRSASR